MLGGHWCNTSSVSYVGIIFFQLSLRYSSHHILLGNRSLCWPLLGQHHLGLSAYFPTYSIDQCFESYHSILAPASIKASRDIDHISQGSSFSKATADVHQSHKIPDPILILLCGPAFPPNWLQNGHYNYQLQRSSHVGTLRPCNMSCEWCLAKLHCWVLGSYFSTTLTGNFWLPKAPTTRYASLAPAWALVRGSYIWFWS